MAREGCAPLRRGLLDHYQKLGALGVSLYVWCLLSMNPETRAFDVTTEELRLQLGTGTTQVSRTLRYLEKHKYIEYIRGSRGRSGRIIVLKPGCPVIGAACPMASTTHPCGFLEERVTEASKDPTRDRRAVRVFRAWNKQGVVAHKKLTRPTALKVIDAIDKYGELAVTDAIHGYGREIREQTFDYRYTLERFVGKHDGENIERFSKREEG